MAGYAKTKLARDWIYVQLCDRIEAGASVLDLGSGVGLLGLLLEELNRSHRVHGIERDERKVAFARRLTTPESPSQVRHGNILEDPWPKANVVVLVDVLHYFPPAAQTDLLHRIADHLGPKGTLFIRVMDKHANGRARLTRLLEDAAVAFRWNRAGGVHWRGLQEILDDLVASGLRPSVFRPESSLLSGNCLITATKP